MPLIGGPRLHSSSRHLLTGVILFLFAGFPSALSREPSLFARGYSASGKVWLSSRKNIPAWPRLLLPLLCAEHALHLRMERATRVIIIDYSINNIHPDRLCLGSPASHCYSAGSPRGEVREELRRTLLGESQAEKTVFLLLELASAGIFFWTSSCGRPLLIRIRGEFVFPVRFHSFKTIKIK